MVKENESVSKVLFRLQLMVLTVLMYFVSFKLTQIFFNPLLVYTSDYLALLFLLTAVWFVGFTRASTVLLSIYQVGNYPKVLKQSVMFVIMGTGILFGLVSLLNFQTIPKEFLFIFGLLDFACIFLSFLLANQYHMVQRKKGRNLTNIIVISDDDSDNFIQKILENRELGFHIKLIISDSQHIEEKYASTIKVLKKSSDLQNIIKSQIIDEVFYCKNQFHLEEVQVLINNCKELGIVFRLHSQVLNLSAQPTQINHFNATPFITYTNTPSNQFALTWKYVFDVLVSFIVLVVWMPVLFAIGILIKLTSKGPIIFKQKRVGLHGREFYIYKFRTMVQDAEKLQEKIMSQNEMDGPAFKIKNDPRITKIGKFLRKTSLDEIPQFFNVLMGDMSLVGPRPPIMREVKQYEAWQLRRLSMRPGITCTWQIQPDRNSISFEEWMKLDLQYIDNWSFEQDLLLTLKTFGAIIKGSGQ
jgi:exopolysaccharide biosynthesis polyprenyl glycosylphosphotransferase